MIPEDAKEEKNTEKSLTNDSAETNPIPEPSESLVQTEELLRKLEEAQKAADLYKDQLLRKAADFENYRRRSEADFVNLIKGANEDLISAILPALDDLARSLKSGGKRTDFDSFYKGIELIDTKLRKILEAQGLKPFTSVGKPFDVEYHDALLQIPRDDVPPHTVIEEVEQGYMFNERVLRHAKVIVSTAPELPPAQGDENTKRPDSEEKSGPTEAENT